MLYCACKRYNAAPVRTKVKYLVGCAVLALVCGAPQAADGDRFDAVRLPDVRLEGLRPTAAGGVSRADTFRPEGIQARYGSAQRTFYDTHLMPELTHQMGGFRSLHGVPGSALEIEQSMIYSSAGESARRKTIKGAGDALKDYLLEVTSINKLIRNVPAPRFGPGRAGVGGRPPRADLGFSFGFAHRMPNVGLRYRVGSTTTRFELSGHGEVDIRFEREDLMQMRTAIGLSYDPDGQRYGMNYNVRF